MSKIKLNPNTEGVILSAIEDGATHAIAAAAAGIHRDTLRNWILKGKKERAVDPYKGFVYRLRISEAKAALIHLRVVKAAALQGQWRASLALLERRWKISREQEHEQEGDIEMPLKANPITDHREYLIRSQTQLQEAMSSARQSESWQAYAALFGKSLSLMEQLRTLDAEEGRVDALDSLTDDQLIKTITDYIIALPKGMRQRVEDELAELTKSNVVILRRQ